MKISFVIPCYRSEKTITNVVNEIRMVMSQRPIVTYEIIAVNDASPDAVYSVLKKMAADDVRIKVINLAKNKGKDAAVFAGYRYVTGQYIVNLDDDGQCPVDKLWKLVDLVETDECDIATARYANKRERGWKLLGSKINTRIESYILDRNSDLLLENFFVMKRFVVDEVIRYNNPFPYFAGSVSTTTDRIRAVPLEKRERNDGKRTGYTVGKSIEVALSGMTNFSVKPLRCATGMGFSAIIISIILGFILTIKKINSPDIAVGWTSVMVAILFSAGIEIALIGIIGEYIGRIFISINNIPQYVIKNTINVSKDLE